MDSIPDPKAATEDVVRVGSDEVRVRRATAADNEALCRLFASVTMDADLRLAVHRDPAFDALYRAQGDEWETWVGEDQHGGLVGLGTLLVRDGYIGGKVSRVGYLGDLRLLPKVRGRELLTAVFGPVMRDFAQRHDVDLFLTAIIASNRRAIRALTGERAQAFGIPPYTLVSKFDIRALHFTVPRRRARTQYEVRRGADGDIGEVARFLDDDARMRPFGYVFSERELRRRLATWPGLCIEDFYLATDRAGGLAGVLAVWDADGAKRTTVEQYRGGMRRIKVGYNAAATIARFPRLPTAGGQLRYLYVTHQAVPGDDPDVLRALLRAVYRDRRRDGYVFLSGCVPVDDPLAPAYRGYVTNDLPAHLYAVTAPGRELPPAALAPGRPGFEMALV